MKNFIFILLISILCLSCSRKNTGTDDVLIIPIASTINEARDGIVGEDIVKKYRIIPLETSDSVLLGEGQIQAWTEEQIIITDNNTVYFFDQLDGHFINKFNRRGHGPGEYLDISTLVFDSHERNIYIYDFSKKSMNVYSPLGKSLAQFSNDSIGTFTITREGQFITSYRPFEKWRNLIGIYDKDWKHLASYFDNPSPEGKTIDLWPIYSINQFNGEPHVYLSDTLYQIAIESVKPVLTLSKGSLKAPEDVFLTTRRSNERGKYIFGDSGFWVGNYYFLHFWYNNAAYYDIWNTSTGELLYRNKRTGPEMPEGIPFDLDGKIVYAWPGYVQNNTIYCFLHFDQASAVYPEYEESDNPVILEIML